MTLTAIKSDRISSGTLYVLIGILTLWVGFKVANFGWEVRFLKDFLMQWEIGIKTFTAQQGAWPVYSGHNHVDYMQALAGGMSRAGLQLPRSNTQSPYRYKIDRFAKPTEDIFVLGFHDRLILFGLSRESAQYLDRAVDRRSDLNAGHFRGYPGKDKTTFIGQWQL